MSEQSSDQDKSIIEIQNLIQDYENTMIKDVNQQDKHLQFSQQFNYLEQIYSPNSKNKIVYTNFLEDNQVLFFDQEQIQHKYYQRIDQSLMQRKQRLKEQNSILNNRIPYKISQNQLKQFMNEDIQQQKQQEDFLGNQMAVFQKCDKSSIIIVKNCKLNNLELYSIYQHEDKIEFEYSQQFEDFKDINLIKGLSSFMNSNKKILVLEYYTEINFYFLNYSTNNNKYKLKDIYCFSQQDFTIRKTSYNNDSQCFIILAQNEIKQISYFFILDKYFNIKNSVPCQIQVTNFQCIGIHNQVIFNNQEQINMFFDLEKSKELLKYSNLNKNHQIVYQVFNFDSFKIFGVVTSDYFQFYDYRFPNTSIHSLQHGQDVPPDNCVYSTLYKNDFNDIDWNTLTQKDQFQKLDMLKSQLNTNKKIFLFSLKKQGQICTIPHIKYPDKDDIINPLAYNVIKEINQATLKNNKFSLLLEHQCLPRQLYTSSLNYEKQKIEGLQIVQFQHNFLSILKEKNGVIILQNFQQNHNKTLNFKQFGVKTFLYQQNKDVQQQIEEDCFNDRKRKVFKIKKKTHKYPKIQFPFKNDFLNKLKNKWAEDTTINQ